MILAIENSRSELANPNLVKTPSASFPPQVQFERVALVENEPTQTAFYRKAVLEKWASTEAIHEVSKAKLSALVRIVVDVEAPVHENDITRRVMEAFGVSRAGSRIVDAVQSAMQYGAAIGAFKYVNGFAHAITSHEVVVRNRSMFENSEKKIEHVASVEIEAALRLCVRQAFSINRADAISEALSQLGFSRSTAAIFGHVNSIVDAMVKQGSLKSTDEKLTSSS